MPGVLVEQFMIEVQSFVAGLPTVVSILAVAGLGVVPFVAAYLGTVIGELDGVSLPLALTAAVLGNTGAVLVAGAAGGAVANRRTNKHEATTSRRARIVDRTEKYGVPITALLAPSLFAISLTTFIMVSVGYTRSTVV